MQNNVQPKSHSDRATSGQATSMPKSHSGRATWKPKFHCGQATSTSGGTSGFPRPASIGPAQVFSAAPSQGTAASSEQAPVRRAHGVLEMAGAAGRTNNNEASLPPKRQRKERQRKERGPNWNVQEVHALIEAKRQQFMEEWKIVDGRDVMVPETQKWHRMSTAVMKVGVSPCPRDGAACKSKWNQLIPEYKRIADYIVRTGSHEAAFWKMSMKDRRSEGLPRSFSFDVFNQIHSWYGNKPSMMPPHCRDLLSKDDSAYNTPLTGSDDADEESDSIYGEQQTQLPLGTADSEDFTGYKHSCEGALHVEKMKRPMCVEQERSSPSPIPAAPAFLSDGVVPVVLSSSDTADIMGRKHPGNTGVRRKNTTGHSLIADATRVTGDALVGQMRDMAAASGDVEREKIEVQRQLFSQRLEYQRERDQRLRENALHVNEISKLSIEKQGQVVECLTNLTRVLHAGLIGRQSSTAAINVDSFSDDQVPPVCQHTEQQPPQGSL